MALWFRPPVASPGPLAGAISLLGLLAMSTYVAWRFGSTLLRTTGWASWGVAWACGSQGGYGYCVAFLVLGTLAWGTGTVLYAKRRGQWPSAFSGRVLARLLGKRSPLGQSEHAVAMGRPYR
jgi:hypothetical protein